MQMTFLLVQFCLYFLRKRGEKFEIIRTRDQEIVKKEIMFFDVGGIYDERIIDLTTIKKKVLERENEIEFLFSFGLIWKHFGWSFV